MGLRGESDLCGFGIRLICDVAWFWAELICDQGVQNVFEGKLNW